MPSDGGDATVISPARGASRPHFAKEADRIYVTTPQGLVSMRFDGTDRRTVISVTGKTAYRPGEPEPADEILVRPDGRWVLARVTNQLYLLALPQSGGEAPKVSVHEPSVPLKKLTDIGADYAAWADGGKTITWAVGSSFFRLPFDSVVFEPLKSEDDKKVEDKDKAEADSQGTEAQARRDRRRRSSGRAAGRAVRSCSSGAKIVTMRGDEVITDGDVVVTDHRIVAVGSSDAVKTPEGAKVIDVSGMTIVPGFVDTHAHWRGAPRRARLADLELLRQPGLWRDHAAATRRPAPTTCSPIKTSSRPATWSARAPSRPGPACSPTPTSSRPKRSRRVVAKYKKYYRTNTLKSYMIGNRRQRQWMIEACHKNEVMPTTEGGIDLKLNLTHAIDGFSGNEHSLPVVPFFADVVELFARTGISYTPTLLVAYGGPFAETVFLHHARRFTTIAKVRRFIPHEVLDSKVRRSAWFHKDEHVYPLIAASAAKVAQAGGHVCIGSHGEMQGIGYHWEMWALSERGLAADRRPARPPRCTEPRRSATPRTWAASRPASSPTWSCCRRTRSRISTTSSSIRYVMKNGELFEGDTLDRIWPEKKPLPRLWWWEEKAGK